MTLEKRLEILQEQESLMFKYRAICQQIGSTIDYGSIDFEREAMLGRKIQETKDWMEGKHKKQK